jgi:adenylosuccinate lyase
MMRSDVGELSEPRGAKQRGSSAMAHKRNPILTEQFQGMPRLVRASAHAAIENVATPEGRDISQSCVERHIAPDATSQVHYLVRKSVDLVKGLVVHTDRMKENLESTMGVWAGQRIRNALMEAGVSYDEAYEYIQKVSFEATDTRTPLYDLVCRVSSPMVGSPPRTVLGILGENKLKNCFDVWDYLSHGLDHLFRDLPDKP